ncbi:hypothetical protein [Sneathiella glossodoripedis]|uniref:hypothetical protein n=1 Tax=Sneathiella glossodoripedis TaxID=418853 RepID=UPI0011DCF970|nr:hypothetical protein [Sneathiella glossodoripedis]
MDNGYRELEIHDCFGRDIGFNNFTVTNALLNYCHFEKFKARHFSFYVPGLQSQTGPESQAIKAHENTGSKRFLFSNCILKSKP